MDYATVVNLCGSIGNQLEDGSEDWATQYAPQGEKHTLDDGTTVWVNTENGVTYVQVALDSREQHFAYDDESAADVLTEQLD